MMRLVQKIMVVLVLAVVPVSAFDDQRRGQDKDRRPPKEPARVIENRKDKPPPQNDRPKKDDRKKPKND